MGEFQEFEALECHPAEACSSTDQSSNCRVRACTSALRPHRTAEAFDLQGAILALNLVASMAFGNEIKHGERFIGKSKELQCTGRALPHMARQVKRDVARAVQ